MNKEAGREEQFIATCVLTDEFPSPWKFGEFELGAFLGYTQPTSCDPGGYDYDLNCEASDFEPNIQGTIPKGTTFIIKGVIAADIKQEVHDPHSVFGVLSVTDSQEREVSGVIGLGHKLGEMPYEKLMSGAIGVLGYGFDEVKDSLWDEYNGNMIRNLASHMDYKELIDEIGDHVGEIVEEEVFPGGLMGYLTFLEAFRREREKHEHRQTLRLDSRSTEQGKQPVAQMGR